MTTAPVPYAGPENARDAMNVRADNLSPPTAGLRGNDNFITQYKKTRDLSINVSYEASK